jgi:hypothetical protein
MLKIAMDRIEDGEEMNGQRWRVTREVSDLPEAPHGRCELALIAVDSRGRTETALPRPPQHELDRWYGRDLRQLVQAMLEHPAMSDCDRYCRHNGLTKLFLWRPVSR